MAKTTPPIESEIGIDSVGTMLFRTMIGRVLSIEIIPVTLTPVSCGNTVKLTSLANSGGFVINWGNVSCSPNIDDVANS